MSKKGEKVGSKDIPERKEIFTKGRVIELSYLILTKCSEYKFLTNNFMLSKRERASLKLTSKRTMYF